MTEKHSKRPRDANQLARLIVGIASGETAAKSVNPKASEHGKIGGMVRAQNMSADERQKAAKRAASKRWEKKD